MENLLTEREMEILKQIFQNKTNREIAKLFHLSIHTIKAHNSEIYRKLNAKNKLDAILTAIRKGYLEL